MREHKESIFQKVERGELTILNCQGITASVDAEIGNLLKIKRLVGWISEDVSGCLSIEVDCERDRVKAIKVLMCKPDFEIRVTADRVVIDLSNYIGSSEEGQSIGELFCRNAIDISVNKGVLTAEISNLKVVIDDNGRVIAEKYLKGPSLRSSIWLEVIEAAKTFSRSQLDQRNHQLAEFYRNDAVATLPSIVKSILYASIKEKSFDDVNKTDNQILKYFEAECPVSICI